MIILLIISMLLTMIAIKDKYYINLMKKLQETIFKKYEILQYHHQLEIKLFRY